MKKQITLCLLTLLLLTSSSLFAQYWEEESGRITTDYQIKLGDNPDNDNAKAVVVSEFSGYDGGGYGIVSRHSSNNQYLNFSTNARIGYSSIWSRQAQSSSFVGLNTITLDNASSIDSRSNGALFILEFDNYSPYNYNSNIHYLGGSHSIIRGNINEYPNKSVLSSVIGEDQLRNENSYAGYFIGRGYFDDNVGFGTTEPKAKIEVADGDIFISDINKGIIMKSPDSQCWRGTLDNEGNLTFEKVDFPGNTLPTNIDILNKSQISSQISIFPNPTSDDIKISVEGYVGDLKYNIYNTSGHKLLSGISSNDELISVNSLSKGVYFVKAYNTNNNELGNSKLVIN